MNNKHYAYGVGLRLLSFLCVSSFASIANLCGSIFSITGGSDYNLTTQSFLLHSGQRRCISVEILDDTMVEQNTERVTLRIGFRSSYSFYYYADIYIQDNDGE